ncbi:carboxypeptidase-like regulatory domain-containing protein [Mucilaginibacter sp. AW1-3]
MRFLFYLLLGVLLPVFALAQDGSITGKVTSADLQMPLAKASVFLSNATYGTSTESDGTFALRGLKPGQYELVVSYVGYDSYHKTLMVGASPIKLDIEMHLKSIGLTEVSVSAHKFSKENYAMFLKYFLGTSSNARQCKILNPKVIDLNYRKNDKILEGHSDDFIIIENRALGYRLKYLLDKFKFDGVEGIISIGGQPLYENLPGSKSQLAKWKAKREDTYYGSSMHFYRSLIRNDLDQQGFVMYRLLRRPNPDRPPQAVIVNRLDHFEAIHQYDSLLRWQHLYNMKKYDEKLIETPIPLNEVLHTTDSTGVFAITFSNNLYVVYKRKHDTVIDNQLYRALDMDDSMVSIVTFYKGYAFFDHNGIVLGGDNVLNEGAWARDKIPELLPVNYEPGN